MEKVKPSILIVTPYTLAGHGIRGIIMREFPEVHVELLPLLEKNTVEQAESSLLLLIVDTAQAHYAPKLIADPRRKIPALGIVGLSVVEMQSGFPSPFDEVIALDTPPARLCEKVRHYLVQPEERHTAPQLSKREIEVLKQLVQGKTAKEIGEILHISMHTVTSHRKNLAAKLGIKSISGMGIYAVSLNLIDPKDVQQGG